MQAILEKISIIRKNIHKIETVQPLWWIVTGTTEPLNVLFEDDYIDYKTIIDEITVLLAGKTLGISKEDKLNLGASLLKLCESHSAYRNFPPDTLSRFNAKVKEILGAKIDVEKDQSIDRDIEEAFKDRARYNSFIRKDLLLILRMRICELCEIQYISDRDLSSYSIQADLIKDGSDENGDDKTQPTFVDTDQNGKNHKTPLTHPQLILLLKRLGVFDLESLAPIRGNAVKLAKLLRVITNKGEQGIRENLPLRYEDGAHNKDDMEVVDDLLKNSGL